MGLPSLNLFPVRENQPIKLGDGKRYFYFGAMLSVDLSRNLLDAIIEATEGKSNIDYSDVLIETLEDYGTMEYVSARTLKLLNEHTDVARQQSNRATWAYLAALDNDDLVGLFWSI